MPDLLPFAGKRVTVMGLGQFGGGVGVVQYLLSHGARVTLTDLRSSEQLQNALQEIDCTQLDQLVLGEHREQDFRDADLIVVNPAVKPFGNRYLQLAKESRIELTSEINLFWQACRGRKIVVTGSVGKSTTASLIHLFLLAAGLPCRLGGNIGISLLPEVDSIREDEFVVLELSSFQLASLDALQPRPELSVITNFYPNHLDWHESIEHYRESKQAAICWQTEEQIAVLNGDDADSALWPTDARVIWFGHEVWRDRPGVHLSSSTITVRTATTGWLIDPTDLAPCLRSRHGMENAAAALAAVVVGLEVPLPAVAPVLAGFETLPHRLEFVAELEGRTFINDSKATTPEAAMAALESLTSPVILIAGGKDKGADFTALTESISKRVKSVVLLGDTAETLRTQLITQTEENNGFAIEMADSMESAVQLAWKLSCPGDVVLLSPACASHAAFINFEQRGERFSESVRALAHS